jgi:hypothetical protein
MCFSLKGTADFAAEVIFRQITILLDLKPQFELVRQFYSLFSKRLLVPFCIATNPPNEILIEIILEAIL